VIAQQLLPETQPTAATVVIVTWNSARTLPGLVFSVRQAIAPLGDVDVYVVDNASSDATPHVARMLEPDVRVFRSSENLGYAAAINRAIANRRSNGPVLVLNPDLIVTPGAITALLAALHRPGVGVAVPRLVNAHGELCLSLRREPTVMRALGEALLGGDRAGRHPELGEVIVDPRAYDAPRFVDWASGAAMLISDECLNAVGSFDESMFLYSEETDFLLRARDRGFEVAYTPDAEMVHLGGEAHTSPRLYALMARNRCRLFARRNGAVAAAGFWAALLLGESLRALAGREVSRAAVAALLTPPSRWNGRP
jgi:GT2 family glycosyltransferase